MNYLTIADVARYLKLSPMMVYRLAQRGEIPGRKIGRVWRFSQEAVDRWMARGTADQGDEVNLILADFVAGLRDVFHRRLTGVILFGSHARREAQADSDIDVLVVLDRVARADRQTISRLAYDVTYGKNRARLLAEVVVDAKTYAAADSPLLLNIRKEGKMAA